MDTGRAIAVLAATAAAVTVAHRAGQRRAQLTAKADAIAACTSLLAEGQRSISSAQAETHAAIGRLEARVEQLLQMGHEVLSSTRTQTRAVAGALEAVDWDDGGRVRRLPQAGRG